MAGGAEVDAQGKYIEKRWREYGFEVSTAEYDVYLTAPLLRSVRIVEPEHARQDLLLQEPALPVDPTSSHPGIVPTFNCTPLAASPSARCGDSSCCSVLGQWVGDGAAGVHQLRQARGLPRARAPRHRPARYAPSSASASASRVLSICERRSQARSGSCGTAACSVARRSCWPRRGAPPVALNSPHCSGSKKQAR
jgi:hypothetical protein